MRRALVPIVLTAALLAAGCGDDGGGRGDLAPGKLFDPADVTSCLRAQRLAVERHPTDTGIDYTVRRRDGRNSIDMAVERSAADAADREQEWRKLAADAGIDNAQDYYFRYGNLLLGYARVPSDAFRRNVERCLA
jgi:hypothetical protein